MTEDQQKELREALKKMLPLERALLPKPQGGAAFIPSYRTYTRDDMALLLFQARLNGGLLPIDIRMELLKGHIVEPNRKPSSLMVLPDHSEGMRNRLKRLRKKFRP